MGWYIECLKKYAVFGGRARRKEYWTFVLFNVLMILALRIVNGPSGGTGGGAFISSPSTSL